MFGNLDFNLGFSHFSLRGLAQVQGELLFLCIAHKSKKLAQRRGYRLAATFPAVIGLITACLNRYSVNFRTLGVIRKKNQFHWVIV